MQRLSAALELPASAQPRFCVSAGRRREQPALEDVGHRAGRGHGDSVGTSSGKEPGLGGRAGRSQGQEHFAFVSKPLLSELSLQLANFSFRRTKPDKLKQQGKKKPQTPAS